MFFDVRMRGFRDRAEVSAVIDLLDRRVMPLDGETIAIAEAGGRLLAEQVRAEANVPGFDRAAMDGYALLAEETISAGPNNALALTVVGEALPGRPFSQSITSGQAVRIMTGAPIPAGADAVLPAEMTQESDGRLIVSGPVLPGRHIGRRGEDVEFGTIVLREGRLLRPQDLGLLASVGIGQVKVVRRPSVDILITGDELLPAGSKPEGYRIVDSNSIMLAALVRRDGGQATVAPLLPDRRDLLRSAIAASLADVLLISGGSSVGKEDHAPSLLAELGELVIHGVAMRPAGPSGIGFLGGRPVFLLPGNPVSCLCAYDLFAGRAIRRLGARAPDMPYRTRQVTLSSNVVSPVGRMDYIRLRIDGDSAEPLASGGASRLSTTTAADGFLLVASESEGYPAGQSVDVFLYDSAS